MFKVELLAKAEEELADAYEWYEKKQAGLGKRFYLEVNHYLNLIETNPHYFAVRYLGDLRSAPLDKFPYLIIYWVEESISTIFVASVFHTSRSPRYY